MAVVDKQQERLEERFRLWDNDGDGRVEREDFEAEARGILQNFGEPDTSPKGRALMSGYMAMYDYLAELGGVGSAGFTLDQFIAVAKEHIIEKGDEGFARVVRPCIRGIVDLCDTDGDGKVEPEEFKRWTDAIGVDRSQADEAFRQADRNNNGWLSVDELVNAVRDYHLGRMDAPLLGR